MGRTRLSPSNAIEWDANTARYRQNGRFISKADVLGIVEGRIDSGIERTRDYLDAVIAGGAPVDAWQTAMMRELKRNHLQAMAVAKGGFANVTQEDYGRVGARLREQYRYLREFSQQIANGELSERQIRARMAQYERSARTAFFDGELSAKRGAGYTQKRRVLNPAEHCNDCIDYAARGWVAITDRRLPPPGKESACLNNCKCDMEYR